MLKVSTNVFQLIPSAETCPQSGLWPSQNTSKVCALTALTYRGGQTSLPLKASVALVLKSQQTGFGGVPQDSPPMPDLSPLPLLTYEGRLPRVCPRRGPGGPGGATGRERGSGAERSGAALPGPQHPRPRIAGPRDAAAGAEPRRLRGARAGGQLRRRSRPPPRPPTSAAAPPGRRSRRRRRDSACPARPGSARLCPEGAAPPGTAAPARPGGTRRRRAGRGGRGSACAAGRPRGQVPGGLGSRAQVGTDGRAGGGPRPPGREERCGGGGACGPGGGSARGL